MNDDLIRQLIQLVKDTSPEIWRIAYRQVYANIVDDIFGMILLGVVAYISQRVFRHYWGIYRETREKIVPDGELAMALSGLSSVIAFSALLYFADHFVMLLINPEYYAIKVIMQLIGLGN